MSDERADGTELESREVKVKLWPKSRLIALSVIYLTLAFFAAWWSLGVAVPRAADISHYQVQKTREFLGTEKALELENFRRGIDPDAESEAEGVAPADEADSTPAE